ncbi:MULTISPECIES: type II toxin-antitoxin system RelB/DinJ family antitoxin [unclassified Adlercreutzia]|uniref:type II toxin-antitoxin system RelB/DinJ family antitoxin n=1 Tax=unclassified Adlercreutzia TaxID=2636013 RepID=UPI0013EC7172|nr:MULTISPECIES: type II toxin-antitoxin system RelB/DinJ family antitoxin [unclassified Adlercreutzia]
MPKQSTIQVRIESDLKESAEELFATLGTSLSEAVRLFVAQSVHDRALPFTPSVRRLSGDDRAFGALAHYANPTLVPSERGAWIKAQGERHARR